MIFLLSAIGLAMAAEITTPRPAPGPVLPSSDPTLFEPQSQLSNILQTLGFSDTCVAAALVTCSTEPEQDQPLSLIQEARGVLKEVSLLVNKSESRPRHCKDLLDSGDSGHGLRLVYPYPGQPHRRVIVYCDHTVDGGGWTVFQRRTNNSIREDFYRSWIEYQLGFGDLEGEFWLGLDHLHILTSTTLQQLRIDLADYESGDRFAVYDFFNVGPSETEYRLKVGRYSGTAEDSMAYHNGSRFSTFDEDNDSYSGGNCPEEHHGAWWYKSCDRCNLNGYQHEGPYTGTRNSEGINWSHWKGGYYSLRRTSMMIRPAF